MITTAKMTKKLRDIRVIIAYALDLIKFREKDNRKQTSPAGRKLSHPSSTMNIPASRDVRGHIIGLLLALKKGSNGLLSGTHSLPNGVTFSPRQWALFHSLFLFHLSKVAIVFPRRNKSDTRPKSERLKLVDIERELACYAAPHGNTKNHHKHWGVCLMHPLHRRVVEINCGNYKEAVAYALSAALNDLGYAKENNYMVGRTSTGLPVATEARLFDNKGVLKRGAQKKAKKPVEKVNGIVKRTWKTMAARFGKPEASLDTPAPPVIEPTKAEKIRGQVNVAGKIQEFFNKGSDHLDSKVPDENLEYLDRELRKINGGLKKVDGGLVFSVNGLHAAASDVKIEPKWTLKIVEKRCALTGKNWSLGVPEIEQSQTLRKEEIRKFQVACKRLHQEPSYSVMCGFLNSIPKGWPRVQVDILKPDNEWVFIDEMNVTSITHSPHDEPGFLNLAEIADKDEFPPGMVFITPALPKDQMTMGLYNIPSAQIGRVRTDLDPAYVVRMGKDAYAAMVLIEQLPQGEWQTHNARLRLGYEYSQKYACDCGIYGIPLPGLPLFPEPYVASLDGKPHTRVSPAVQNDLVTTWQTIQAEELEWWKRVPLETRQWLAGRIEADLAQHAVPLSEVLPGAIAIAGREWVSPVPHEKTSNSPTAPAKDVQTPAPPLVSAVPPKKKPKLENRPTLTPAKSAMEPATKQAKLEQPPAGHEPSASQSVPPATAQQTTKAKPEVALERVENSTPISQFPPSMITCELEDEEEERRKRLAAKKRLLLAGLYKFMGQLSEAEELIARLGLDVADVKCAEMVWMNLYRHKNDGRPAELKGFIGTPTHEEPEWLSAEFEAALQNQVLEEQLQQQEEKPQQLIR